MEKAPPIGLSARELKKRWDWLTKYPPKDPAAALNQIGEIVSQLIAENNAAIAAELDARKAREGGEP